MVPELPAGRLPLIRRFDAGAPVTDRVEDARTSWFVPSRRVPNSECLVGACLIGHGRSRSGRKVEEDFRCPRSPQFLAQWPPRLPGPERRTGSPGGHPATPRRGDAARFRCSSRAARRDDDVDRDPHRIRDGEKKRGERSSPSSPGGGKRVPGQTRSPQCFRRPGPCQPRFDFQDEGAGCEGSSSQSISGASAIRSLSSRSVSARSTPTRQRSASR